MKVESKFECKGKVEAEGDLGGLPLMNPLSVIKEPVRELLCAAIAPVIGGIIE